MLPSHASLDVTSSIAAWLYGGVPNYGWIFVGEGESAVSLLQPTPEGQVDPSSGVELLSPFTRVPPLYLEVTFEEMHCVQLAQAGTATSGILGFVYFVGLTVVLIMFALFWWWQYECNNPTGKEMDPCCWIFYQQQETDFEWGDLLCYFLSCFLPWLPWLLLLQFCSASLAASPAWFS